MDKDNLYAFWLRAAGGALVLAAHAGSAEAIPVSIAWDVPVQAAERYQLEVATDPGFAETVLRQEVRGSGFLWDAPKEGVYHWRLNRLGAGPQTPPQGPAAPSGLALPGLEGSTFVSGSFVAIDGDIARQKAARLTWDAEPGADRYKLYVSEAGGSPRTMISTTNVFVVPVKNRHLMIEVVPYSGQHRTFRYYHFNPTLKLDSGLPPPPPPPPPVVAEAPKMEPALPSEKVPTRRRRHKVHVFGLAGEEVLHFQKLEVGLKSRERVYGGGGGVWSNPVGGLVVDAEGTYHEHEADATQPLLFDDAKFPVKASRYTAELAVGWDLLWGFGAESHMLTLSVAGAQTQLPMLPVELDRGNGEAPRFQRRQLSMIGGTLAYGFFWKSGGVVAEGGAFAEESDDVEMSFGRLTIELYPTEHVLVELGGASRATSARRCHEDAATCLVEGNVKTTASEAYGFLGLGAVFR